MTSADICVVPKILSAHSPLKLYEYMAAGKPVIASDLPGFEIVKETGCGQLFPSGNAKALFEKIQYLLALTPEERYAMGQKGRQKILVEFNWNQVAQKTHQILREVCQ